MTVSEELKEKAVKLGLCKEWTDGWVHPDLDSLCEMMISGLDFCIKNDYPSNEYIKENFGQIARNHGIFVDEEIDLLNPDVAILNGNTKGKITLSGFVSRDIYVRHDSEVEIDVKYHAVAFIRLFDNSKVKVINSSSGRVFVYKYTDSFVGDIEVEGNVMIREKQFSDL
ncbi:MAG: hypothetical protein QM660_10795 [Dysgonomonas sp.]